MPAEFPLGTRILPLIPQIPRRTLSRLTPAAICVSPLRNDTRQETRRVCDRGGAFAPGAERLRGETLLCLGAVCLVAVGGFPHTVCKEHRARRCLNGGAPARLREIKKQKKTQSLHISKPRYPHSPRRRSEFHITCVSVGDLKSRSLIQLMRKVKVISKMGKGEQDFRNAPYLGPFPALQLRFGHICCFLQRNPLL